MANHLVLSDAPRRSFVATENFFNYFKSYTTRIVDLETVGVFGNAASDCAQTPKGRILRENGRKLFPGANPNVGKYMIGVYDAETFLNGFIDPNSHVFALFSTEKPNFFDNDADSEHGSDNDDQTEGDDIGNPVYTRGNIETTEGTITAGDVTSNTYVALDASTGKTYQTGVANFKTYAGRIQLNGNGPAAWADVVFSTPLPAYTQEPCVFLTATAAIDVLYYDSFSTTGFTIRTTTNGSTAWINWMVVGYEAAPQPDC